MAGIHLLAVAAPASHDASGLTAEEQGYLDAVAAWSGEEGAYPHQQMTRPLTLSYGLSDSPAGLLGWIVEKYRAWSDCDGDLSARFSDDFLLTAVALLAVLSLLAAGCTGGCRLPPPTPLPL